MLLLKVLINKPPKWSDALGACVFPLLLNRSFIWELQPRCGLKFCFRYCLNFHGRVTVASVKNFQMCYEQNVEPVLLQVTCDV